MTGEAEKSWPFDAVFGLDSLVMLGHFKARIRLFEYEVLILNQRLFEVRIEFNSMNSMTRTICETLSALRCDHINWLSHLDPN